MFKNIFIVSLLFVCINVVSAEELSDISVTSSEFTNSISESKYPLHIMQNEEINVNRSIGDNLKGLSGLSNADYGAAVGQPVIRGLTGNRTRLLSNNIPINDLSNLSGDHINNIDLNNISHIEILRGPSSIFNRGGTSGGIINVITDIISENKYDNEVIKLDYTTVNNGYGHNFLFKKNYLNANIFFSINNKHMDNYNIPNGSLLSEDTGLELSTLANSDHKNQNTSFGLSFPREWGYFGFSFENTDGVYGLPYHAEEEEEGHHEEEEEHRLFTKTETETYTLKGKFNTVPLFNSIDYSFRNSNSFLKEHEEDGSASLDSNRTSFDFNFNLDDELYEKRFLLQYGHTKSPMTGAYLPSSEAYERSISYFIRTKNRPYEIDFAGRYESNSRDSDNQRYGDTSLSFGTSFAANLGESFMYNMNYAHISRSPSVAELFANGVHGATSRYERGNNRISREVSRNIELNLEYNFNDIDMNLNLYRNNINNFIYLKDESTTTSGKTDATWSQKSAVMQGYEISMSSSYMIGNGDLLVTLSRDDISGVFDDNTYIPRLSPAKNTLSLKYENNKSDTYYANLIYTESQGDMSSIETKTNSHLDLDIGYSKKITYDSNKDLVFNLYGNNILNKTIRNHSSLIKDHVPVQGANYGIDVSMRYNF
ncbi:MAG: TonB-dependent receptor [Gammaproteobacteria bacterium]|nr:TonB-dependent receptor [Gammaproteobacteria bacterium]